MDVNDFVGIPWKLGGSNECGADCWGLVLMVLPCVYDIRMNSFEGSCATGEELSNIIEGETNSAAWEEVHPARPGDVVVFYDKQNGKPGHMGVFVGDGRVIHSLHAMNNGSSSIHEIRIIRRLFKRVEYYRYDSDNN